MAETKLPLEGIKVADFSWFGAGPICAEHLATYGATVVRVESETHIDALRTVQPFAKGKTNYNASGYFNNYNAGQAGPDAQHEHARRAGSWRNASSPGQTSS